MNDRERILTTIIRKLASTQLLALNGYNEAQFKRPGSDTMHVHFQWEGADFNNIPIGSLVLCETSGFNEPHDFQIGYLVEKGNHGDAIIREIGSDRLGRVTNESFRPIVGMYEQDLWERDERELYRKIIKAIRKSGEDWHRYARIEMGKPATLYIREKWGGLTNPTKPYPITIKWNKKTSIKNILQQMLDQGFGTREFELVNPKEES